MWISVVTPEKRVFSRDEKIFLIDFMLEHSAYQFKEAIAQSLGLAALFHLHVKMLLPEPSCPWQSNPITGQGSSALSHSDAIQISNGISED